MNILEIIFLIFTVCTGNPSSSKNINGYKLNSPDLYLILPEALHEVSGITIIDQSTYAFIQDEKGKLYIYDVVTNKIKQELMFGEKGDYEDLARVNNSVYVLRSDGKLYEISDFMSMNFKVTSYQTDIPSKDNEGLCYDKENNRLLIGTKAEIDKKEFKNRRGIYAFNLKTKKLNPEPVFLFNPHSVKKMVEDKLISISDKKDTDKDTDITLKISAIAIHPITGTLYLLSGVDNKLYILDKKGSVVSIELLSQKLFNQAEGLAFLPNGDMIITNEGGKGQPTLLRFNYNKN